MLNPRDASVKTKDYHGALLAKLQTPFGFHQLFLQHFFSGPGSHTAFVTSP